MRVKVRVVNNESLGERGVNNESQGERVVRGWTMRVLVRGGVNNVIVHPPLVRG